MNNTSALRSATEGLARLQLPVLFLLCLVFIGVAEGFLISTDSITNKLSCGYNTAGIFETYTPPETMAKGDECTKEVSVKNAGSVSCYVRMFIEEEDPDVRENLKFDMDETSWSAKATDGYYYYAKVLKPGESTEPLLKTITASEQLSNLKIICYSETVQAYGFDNPQEAFAAIR